MRVPLPYLLVAGVVTAVVVGGGVVALGSADDEPTPTDESFETTPLSELDTTGLVVSRGPFCDAIDDRQVDAVLGAVPDAQEWENGDEIDLTGTGTEDVVHEFGCSYAVQDVGVARAWVYAPPVDAAQAQRLVKQASKGPGLRGRRRAAVRHPDARAHVRQGRNHAGVVPRAVRRRLAGLRGRAPGWRRSRHSRRGGSLVRRRAGGGGRPSERVTC